MKDDLRVKITKDALLDKLHNSFKKECIYSTTDGKQCFILFYTQITKVTLVNYSHLKEGDFLQNN